LESETGLPNLLPGLQRSLLVMVDSADALQNPVTGQVERGELQRDWIIASAECGRQAREALLKAAEVLAENIPGRRPDAELALAWAEIGRATLSHAEAARSVASAAFAVDQGGVNTFPNT
jgi:hypothetical protein